MSEHTTTGVMSVLKSCVPVGRKNAISTKDLMAAAGYTDTRTLRQDIRRLRIDGEVILSSTQHGGGYYRPQCKAELQHFIKQEEHRAKSIFYSLKAARRLLKKADISSQIRITQCGSEQPCITQCDFAPEYKMEVSE